MKNPTITKLEDNIFRFEFDEADDAKKLRNLRQFNFDNNLYKIKKVVMAIEIPFYFSYIVITR